MTWPDSISRLNANYYIETPDEGMAHYWLVTDACSIKIAVRYDGSTAVTAYAMGDIRWRKDTEQINCSVMHGLTTPTKDAKPAEKK